MITLYHGSNVRIDRVDLSRCRPGKDFGQGFYLNPNYNQAYEMAQRTTRIMMTGEETVTAFLFDEALLLDARGLRIKVFDDYTEEWAQFVVANRKNMGVAPIHDYDIVIGPIADDSVGTQIRRYIEGYIPVTQLVDELRFHGDHAVQYFFATERALECLIHAADE